eukprot:TRINITY_DN7372_c2_g1_i1.p1 TRINITY_DN7372_c2_g1~~TRINITY_DN7372_c2_g1_i1.p1  ORF type:complete len:446 (+),score=92.61 TRINITY_DN7372_c2_g1_i1:48-1340(+)
MKQWEGKWSPLRLDTVPLVVSEVKSFVEVFNALKAEMESNMVPNEGLGPMERRKHQMLRSAQLRLDILTHFYDTHKKDKRSERIKIAVRTLRGLLAEQGVEEDQFVPEVSHGPMSMRDPSQSPTTSQKGKNLPSSLNIPSSPSAGAADSPQSDRKDEPTALQLLQQKNKEDGLRSRLKFSTERETELTGKISTLEQENLKLERAMLEMSEGRERMKSIVEEQVYTVSLMTKVTGLLHFELKRTLFKTVSQGIIFWCLSTCFVIHTIVTAGIHLINTYMFLRGHFDDSLGVWSMLFIDCVAVSILLGLAHEWVSFADHDINHGSIHWFIESVVMRRDDAVEAARKYAARYTEHVVKASQIDLSAYQRTQTQRNEVVAAAAAAATNPNSTTGSLSVPPSPPMRGRTGSLPRASSFSSQRRASSSQHNMLPPQ